MKAWLCLWGQLTRERNDFPKLTAWIRGTLRGRFLFLFGGAVLVLLISLQADPDGGLSTILGGLSIAQGLWAITAAFVVLKILHDYIEADSRNLFHEARKGSIGAGLALVAKAITFYALVSVFAPRAHADEVPAGFWIYGPQLKAEQERYWADHSKPYLLASLAEQEGCKSQKSKDCWNPSVRLKTSREEGAGMGQLTRAYRKDGSLRFDALASLRNQYRSELDELSWRNVYTRPELQFRAMVLMSKDAAKPFRAAPDMLAFGDSAYNGGPSDVQKARRACALTDGCDPGKWFKNVELHCMKSRQPIYGGRNACDINLEHVHNVFLERPEKYRKAWVRI